MDRSLSFQADVLRSDVTPSEEPPRYDNGVQHHEETKVTPRIPFQEASIITRGDDAAFASEGLHDYSKPIDSYEGRHRWDPEFEWDEKEERRLIRKVGKDDSAFYKRYSY